MIVELCRTKKGGRISQPYSKAPAVCVVVIVLWKEARIFDSRPQKVSVARVIAVTSSKALIGWPIPEAPPTPCSPGPAITGQPRITSPRERHAARQTQPNPLVIAPCCLPPRESPSTPRLRSSKPLLEGATSAALTAYLQGEDTSSRDRLPQTNRLVTPPKCDGRLFGRIQDTKWRHTRKSTR